MTTPDDRTGVVSPGLRVPPRRKTRLMVLLVRSFVRNRIAVASLGILVLFSMVAIFAPWVAPYDPLLQNYEELRLSPSLKHPMGTDNIGRDMFSRVVYGARVSLMVGFLSVWGGGSIGVLLGVMAAYYGRWMDSLIMRTADVYFAFPGLLLILIVVTVLGPSVINTILAISIGYIFGNARLVRANALSIREQEYVMAARSIGAGDWRIMLTGVLPNVVSTIIVAFSLGMGGAILAESGLSFLGLGIRPPTASWGTMAATGRTFITLAWWMTVFPGLAIFLAVVSLNLVGDGLREALDPRQRRR